MPPELLDSRPEVVDPRSVMSEGQRWQQTALRDWPTLLHCPLFPLLACNCHGRELSRYPKILSLARLLALKGSWPKEVPILELEKPLIWSPLDR